MKNTFDVISPDGFSIHPVETYSSLDEALKAFENWKQRYQKQGYYSSNHGRITLDDLINHVKIITL